MMDFMTKWHEEQTAKHAVVGLALGGHLGDLRAAAAAGDQPFIDLLKSLLANAPALLDLVIKYLPLIIPMFK